MTYRDLLYILEGMADRSRAALDETVEIRLENGKVIELDEDVSWTDMGGALEFAVPIIKEKSE